MSASTSISAVSVPCIATTESTVVVLDSAPRVLADESEKVVVVIVWSRFVVGGDMLVTLANARDLPSCPRQSSGHYWRLLHLKRSCRLRQVAVLAAARIAPKADNSSAITPRRIMASFSLCILARV
jgi:hypothetical protein